MEKPRNPFILGHRIPRPYFCDREQEQQNLTSAVTNGRNVVLISPRRMGKTTLTYLALNDCNEIFSNYLILFFDILQTNSLAEFTYLLGKSIFNLLRSKNETWLRNFIASLKSLSGTFGFDPISGTPTFNIQLGDVKHPEYTLDEIFRYIESSEKPIIIVIDEFQQITKYPERNTEAILRSHIQQLTDATFVFAGSESTLLQEMFISSKRPFYNSAEIMHLGPINELTYIEFAKDLFHQYNKSVEDEPIRWAFQLFDGNTFYLQRTLNGAFADTAEYGLCDHETIRRSINSMLAANEVIYRELLSNISISQKSVLLAIAKEKTAVNITGSSFVKRHALASPSSVQSAVVKLVKAGLVTRNEKGHIVTDPLLRIFINKVYFTSDI